MYVIRSEQHVMDESTVEEPQVHEVWCRHCGARTETADPNWLCSACDHYQDQMPCPTCGQQVLISLLPPDLVPPPHDPEE
jgi:hypothetical protein